MTNTTVTADEIELRTIRRAELIPDRSAFIDTVLPECAGKENYALIGPGVSENPDQIVPVTDPHGFNLGVAALPHGITNSLHLHFTAEVFSCMSGKWLFRWGVDGTDGEAIIEPGDVISMPSWMFRGFTNIGSDDGWMFSSLGQDETGGILWAPSVLQAAAALGNFLTIDNKMITGEPNNPPQGVQLTQPLPQEELDKLPKITPEQMRARLAKPQDLEWSDTAFLCSGQPGGRAELALVIGYGITENRVMHPRIHNPHGFTIAWLRAEPGEGLLQHRIGHSQVYMVQDGRWRITLNQEDNFVSTEVGPLDTFSFPKDTWRSIENIGDGTGHIVAMTGGDGRTPIEWTDEVRAAGLKRGIAHDPDRYLAPAAVVCA